MTQSKIFEQSKSYLQGFSDCNVYADIFAAAAPSATRSPAPLAKKDASNVVSHIKELQGQAVDRSAELVDTLISRPTSLDWWNAYDDDTPSGQGFSESTAASLLVGPGAPYTCDTGRSGFFYLRQGLTYLPHNHEPDEIYAVVAGRASFWSESGGWRIAGAGEIIHTPRWSWHGMKTDLGPVLILWAWVGAGLDTEPGFKGAPNW